LVLRRGSVLKTRRIRIILGRMEGRRFRIL